MICWSLVIALPITTIVSLPLRPNDLSAISVSGWSAFIYLSLVSQLLAFFIWYKGLALGGIARVSQTQLFQPIVTLIAAALLAKEHVDSNTLLFAATVISIVCWRAKRASARNRQLQKSIRILKDTHHERFEVTDRTSS